MNLLRFRLGAVTMFIALCALAAGIVLQAHTTLEKSEPANGSTVAGLPMINIWFNEEVDVKVSKIVLTGPSGAVALGATHTMAPKSISAMVGAALADGAYTIDWQTAGDDGHTVKGAIKFKVKK